MKSNRSLALSSKLQEFQKANILSCLADVFPDTELLEVQEINNSESLSPKTKKSRNRMFTFSETLLTMVLTASQEDKTLKNSVALYYSIHQNKRKKILESIEEEKQKEKKLEELNGKKSRGRPKLYKIPESLKQDKSLGTSAYSDARKRVPIKMIDKLFEASKIKQVENEYSHWHGHSVYISDGTYLQMQDSPELRAQYEAKRKGDVNEGYPKALLQALINRGSGQITFFTLSDIFTSELALFHKMLDEIEENSIILLDDLYNCYEIMAKCVKKKIEIVVPGERVRNYTVEKRILEGDEIVRIEKPKERSSWANKEEEISDFLILRRIECISPEGKEYILYTTVLDKKIKKEEIQNLYFTRWDIEISIREIKTVMDINILRSKSPEMIMKELTISLATYNLIRKLIYDSVKDYSFFPEADFIYGFYSHNKSVHIDKKGRLYNRWSPGCRGAKESNTKEIAV